MCIRDRADSSPYVFLWVAAGMGIVLLGAAFYLLVNQKRKRKRREWKVKREQEQKSERDSIEWQEQDMEPFHTHELQEIPRTERDEKRPHGIYVGKVHDIGTVSYTHLDVYKRQLNPLYNKKQFFFSAKGRQLAFLQEKLNKNLSKYHIVICHPPLIAHNPQRAADMTSYIVTEQDKRCLLYTSHDDSTDSESKQVTFSVSEGTTDSNGYSIGNNRTVGNSAQYTMINKMCIRDRVYTP